METSLHRQLKEFYCGDAGAREVIVAGYRVDAVLGRELVEIQAASLSALRRKLAVLLREFQVTVVKPLASHKTIHRRGPRGEAVRRRVSPRHESPFDLFREFVHLAGLFPHPRLTVELLLTEQEEVREQRKMRRRGRKDYVVIDRRLTAILERRVFRTADDLAAMLPAELSEPFTTLDLARLAAIPRWLAQKMAYCLRHAGAIDSCGKQGTSRLYRRRTARRSKAG